MNKLRLSTRIGYATPTQDLELALHYENLRFAYFSKTSNDQHLLESIERVINIYKLRLFNESGISVD